MPSPDVADTLRIGRRRLALALILASALSGCAALDTDPHIASETQDLPTAFPSSSRLDRPEVVSFVDFWSAFGAPELVDFIRRAETGSLDIVQAIARVDEAAAVRDQAATAFLPGGGGTVSATRARASAAAAGARQGVILPDTRLFQLGLSATYEIDFWGKNAAALLAAQNRVEANRFDVETTRLTVTAGVATLYLSALALKDQIAIARGNIQLSRRIAASVRERVEAGAATVIDQARQDTLVFQQEATLPQLVRALGETETRLAVLLGDPRGRMPVRCVSLDLLALPRLDPGIPTDLLRRRPDLAAAEQRVLASAENVTTARANMLPSVTLSGTAGGQSGHIGTLLSPQALAFQLVSGAVVPIFDQVRLAAVLRGTSAQQEELLAAYRGAIVSSIADVEAALIDLRTLQEEENRLAGAVSKARQAVGYAGELLHAGQLDLTTLLDTQTAYFTTVNNRKLVQLARFQAGVALYKALGGGWRTRDLSTARSALAAALPSPVPQP